MASKPSIAACNEDNELDFRLLDVKSRPALPARVWVDAMEMLATARSASRTRMARAAGHLPLSEGARLRWLGISEDFVPLTLGPAGMSAMAAYDDSFCSRLPQSSLHRQIPQGCCARFLEVGPAAGAQTGRAQSGRQCSPWQKR